MSKGKKDAVCHINDTQMALLASAAIAVGYCDEARHSWRRFREALKSVTDQDAYDRLARRMAEQHAPPRQTTVAQLNAERRKSLAAAITPWGATHFEQILALVRLLPPGPQGVGYAEKFLQRRAQADRDMSIMGPSTADFRTSPYA